MEDTLVSALQNTVNFLLNPTSDVRLRIIGSFLIILLLWLLWLVVLRLLFRRATQRFMIDDEAMLTSTIYTRV